MRTGEQERSPCPCQSANLSFFWTPCWCQKVLFWGKMVSNLSLVLLVINFLGSFQVNWLELSSMASVHDKRFSVSLLLILNLWQSPCFYLCCTIAWLKTWMSEPCPHFLTNEWLNRSPQLKSASENKQLWAECLIASRTGTINFWLKAALSLSLLRHFHAVVKNQYIYIQYIYI